MGNHSKCVRFFLPPAKKCWRITISKKVMLEYIHFEDYGAGGHNRAVCIDRKDS